MAKQEVFKNRAGERRGEVRKRHRAHGEALATAQDATALPVLQFLANMAAANSQGDPAAAALVKALTVNAQGQTIKIGLSLPQAQFEQLVKPRARVTRKKTAAQ
jgi:hypothetical protein